MKQKHLGPLMAMEKKDLEVSIIGGGLVGSLCACILGNQGIRVKVYEYRSGGIRNAEIVEGRSMNLLLSERGLSALRLAGMKEEAIIDLTIPIKGRILHTKDGQKIPFLSDRTGRYVYSIIRKDLNEVIIAAAKKNPNIDIFFKHKFINYDFKINKFQIMRPDGGVEENSADLLIGCDGAYSAVRKQMLRTPRFNHSQSYFEHGYIELAIPPTSTGEFAMEGDFLHFWPRENFMLTALPNRDCSYTVSLFMPFEMFEKFNTPEKLFQLFKENFPEAIPLIGKEKLIADFFKAKPSSMVSVKCNPYHWEDKILLIGDAAHAMLPFNGQGMNAGFEDCEILSELLSTYNYDLKKVLPEYTRRRQKDAEIICDLAKATFNVMKLHTSKKFLFLSKLDNLLNTIFPRSWIVLSTEVTFSKMPYSQCFARKQKQDKIVSTVLWSVVIVGFCFAVSMFARL
ncbi:kynurenine 3-monooxygenase-like [Argiope bruennichi]|uniref:kynurenine 3-monooxygenase-like n=1 Tax=Argiope bruennichi TaxID=94029 RepID=UPI00249448D1|nr:kynurenine 3-monooxygenase-like [Argiope bruennichi]